MKVSMNKILKCTICFILILVVFLSAFSFVGCKHQQAVDEYISATFMFSTNNDTISYEKKMATLSSLNTMLVKNGFLNAKVELSDDNSVIVYLPKSDKSEQMFYIMGIPSYIEFRREGMDEFPSTQAYVTTEDIKEVWVGLDENKHYVVTVKFDKEGTKKFALATQERLNQSLNIWIDGKWLIGPQVTSIVSDGVAALGLNYSFVQACEVAVHLQMGALGLKLTGFDF